jgi:HK97 gp10 family phage protein
MSFVISGVEEIQKILEEVAPRHAKNLMRTTIHGVAGEIKKISKSKAPKGRTGNLRKAIKTKRNRAAFGKLSSSVYITTGKSAKNDAFYWRFVEYGTGGGSGSHGGKKRNRKSYSSRSSSAKPFIAPAVKAIKSNLNNIIKRQFGQKLEKAVKREMRKGSRK